MKIVFYMPSYSLPVPPVFGGAVETLTSFLLNENEKKKNFEFLVIQPNVSYKIKNNIEKKFKKTKFAFVRKNKVYDFFAKIFNKIFGNKNYKMPLSYENKSRKIIKMFKPDKIIFEGNIPETLLSKISEDHKRENLYLHIHSHMHNKNGILNYCNNIISVSKFLIDDWLGYYNINKDSIQKKPKMLLLKNCINKSFYTNSITKDDYLNIRKNLGLSPNDFVVLYCGRIVDIKGVHVLIDAINELSQENIKLLIIGSSNFAKKTKTKYTQNIINKINQNRKNIIFTGYIRNDELYKYYQISSCQVIPSLCEEAAGLVLIEGMSAGLPQIYTNSGGMPEYASNECICVDKKKGLKQQIKEALLRIKNNKTEISIKKIKEDSTFYTEENYYKQFTVIMGGKQ